MYLSGHGEWGQVRHCRTPRSPKLLLWKQVSSAPPGKCLVCMGQVKDTAFMVQILLTSTVHNFKHWPKHWLHLNGKAGTN